MKKLTSRGVIVIITSLIITTSIVIGMVLSGPPSEQRSIRLDQDRVNHLVSITYEVDSYWTREKKLPASLEELTQTRYTQYSNINDPQTGIPYEYTPLGPSTYQLCALFEQPSLAKDDPRSNYYGDQGDFWKHGAGRICYTIEVRKPDNLINPGEPKPIYNY